MQNVCRILSGNSLHALRAYGVGNFIMFVCSDHTFTGNQSKPNCTFDIAGIFLTHLVYHFDGILF